METADLVDDTDNLKNEFLADFPPTTSTNKVKLSAGNSQVNQPSTSSSHSSSCPSRSTPSESSSSTSARRIGEAKKRKAKNAETSANEVGQYEELLDKLLKVEKEVEMKDCNDTFGEYIALELKKLTPLDQAIMKRDIMNLISDFQIKQLAAADPNIQIVNMVEES